MDVLANGVRFNCALGGRLDGPWLILAHGVATNLDLWTEAAERLSAGYRLLRYDIRGHGGTDRVPGPYSFDMLCADAVALMDALDIPRAHFAGVSLGGMTGLGLALDHAGRFDRLVVCNAGDQAGPAYIANWEARCALVEEQGIEAIVEQSVERWLGARALSDEALVGRVGAMVRGTSPEGYLGAAEALKRLGFRARLGEISRPVLYLAGGEDRGASPETMRAMQAATPGARYVEIPGAGHLSVLEAPQQAAEAILGFLAAD